MGQAKKRGSYEQRVRMAKKKKGNDILNRKNLENIFKGIDNMAMNIININENANYDADLTPEIIEGGNRFIADNNLTNDDSANFWNIVRNYNLHMGKVFEVDFYSDEAKDDMQKFLDKHQIPQNVQVMLGLYDYINGILMKPKPGTMQVYNLKEMFG